MKKDKTNTYKVLKRNIKKVGLSKKDKQIISRLLLEYSETFTSLYEYDKRNIDQ